MGGRGERPAGAVRLIGPATNANLGPFWKRRVSHTHHHRGLRETGNSRFGYACDTGFVVSSIVTILHFPANAAGTTTLPTSDAS